MGAILERDSVFKDFKDAIIADENGQFVLGLDFAGKT